MLKSGICVALLTLAAPLALAQGQGGEGPCRQVKEACEKAGFVQGKAKTGKGLWKDCVSPIMAGSAAPANTTLPLPTVDPTVVAACKAKNPNYGNGSGKAVK